MKEILRGVREVGKGPGRGGGGGRGRKGKQHDILKTLRVFMFTVKFCVNQDVFNVRLPKRIIDFIIMQYLHSVL